MMPDQSNQKQTNLDSKTSATIRKVVGDSLRQNLNRETCQMSPYLESLVDEFRRRESASSNS